MNISQYALICPEIQGCKKTARHSSCSRCNSNIHCNEQTIALACMLSKTNELSTKLFFVYTDFVHWRHLFDYKQTNCLWKVSMCGTWWSIMMWIYVCTTCMIDNWQHMLAWLREFDCLRYDPGFERPNNLTTSTEPMPTLRLSMAMESCQCQMIYLEPRRTLKTVGKN